MDWYWYAIVAGVAAPGAILNTSLRNVVQGRRRRPAARPGPACRSSRRSWHLLIGRIIHKQFA
jgi:hypothetical protein